MYVCAGRVFFYSRAFIFRYSFACDAVNATDWLRFKQSAFLKLLHILWCRYINDSIWMCSALCVCCMHFPFYRFGLVFSSARSLADSFSTSYINALCLHVLWVSLPLTSISSLDVPPLLFSNHCLQTGNFAIDRPTDQPIDRSLIKIM